MAANTQNNLENDNPKGKNGTPRKAIFAVILLAGIVFGGRYGYGKYTFGQSHVSTDDAYVSGDLVYVSPTINGLLVSLDIEEGSVVKKGQLIARLKDSSQQAALRQAKAAYESALAQIPQAKSNLEFQKLSTEAAIQKARAAISAQRTRTLSARQNVQLSSDTLTNQVVQAKSQVLAAEANYAQATAQTITAKAAVESAKQQVVTAEIGSKVAAAKAQAAQSDLEKSLKDLSRYKSLLAQQAISNQQFDAVQSQTESFRAHLEAAIEEASQSRSNVETAKQTVKQMTAAYESSVKSADAYRQQVTVAKAGLGLVESSKTNIAIQKSAVTNNVELTQQAVADLSTAEAGREQINLRKAQVDAATAQLELARAQLVNAQIAEDDTYIYAPNDGIVVKKTANVGMSLVTGQTIATITSGDHVWVEANFKETQLKDARPGQSVEIEIDTYPDTRFQGHIASISRATGSATTLIPPDNATGNFTKVVQRIPVRIEFDNVKQNSDQFPLRQGMSAAATINISAVPRAK